MWETVCTIDELQGETLPENLLELKAWLDTQIAKIPYERQKHATLNIFDTTHCGTHYNLITITYPVVDKSE
jgi:hypothetical protein